MLVIKVKLAYFIFISITPKSPDFGDSGSGYCYKSLKEYIFNKFFVDLSRVASVVIASHG